MGHHRLRVATTFAVLAFAPLVSAESCDGGQTGDTPANSTAPAVGGDSVDSSVVEPANTGPGPRTTPLVPEPDLTSPSQPPPADPPADPTSTDAGG